MENSNLRGPICQTKYVRITQWQSSTYLTKTANNEDLNTQQQKNAKNEPLKV